MQSLERTPRQYRVGGTLDHSIRRNQQPIRYPPIVQARDAHSADGLHERGGFETPNPFNSCVSAIWWAYGFSVETLHLRRCFSEFLQPARQVDKGVEKKLYKLIAFGELQLVGIDHR
jgi:hypothetical protein